MMSRPQAVSLGSFIHGVVDRTSTKKGCEIVFFLSQSKDRLSFQVHKCHFSDQEWYLGIHKMPTIQFLFSTIKKYYLLRIDGDFFK